MDYQVWTKDEFGETYTKKDCGDLSAVKRELDAAVRRGADLLLTVAVPFEVGIKVGDVGAEVAKRPADKTPKEEKKEEGPKHEADQSAA